MHVYMFNPYLYVYIYPQIKVIARHGIILVLSFFSNVKYFPKV